MNKITYPNAGSFDLEVKHSASNPERYNSAGKIIISLSNVPSPEETLSGTMPESYDNNPENNKLWRAYNRAEVANQKAAITACRDQIIDDLIEDGQLDARVVRENIKFVFSKNAGCSCGCSPGFVLKFNGKNMGTLQRKNVFVWISLSNEEIKAKDELNTAYYSVQRIASALKKGNEDLTKLKEEMQTLEDLNALNEDKLKADSESFILKYAGTAQAAKIMKLANNS